MQCCALLWRMALSPCTVCTALLCCTKEFFHELLFILRFLLLGVVLYVRSGAVLCCTSVLELHRVHCDPPSYRICPEIIRSIVEGYLTFISKRKSSHHSAVRGNHRLNIGVISNYIFILISFIFIEIYSTWA